MKWMEEIDYSTENEHMVKYLVGNCVDLIEDDGMSMAKKIETVKFMKDFGFTRYIETSAKTGFNVDHLFETLTKHLFLVYD